MAGRTLISKLSSFSTSAAARFSTASAVPRSAAATRTCPLNRLRPLMGAGAPAIGGAAAGTRWLSTRATTSSLNDPTPNWSNRPPKETILLDGCDFEHWLVVVEPPDQSWTRDQIIESYIKILAEVVGSVEEARFKIYSVSTKHYFAFGALVPEELSYKLKELPTVRWVLPDSYLDVKNKDYGGEPFINGEAVPYDPKYHEEWVRNNARANERSRRNDRPRDRTRNFERRRENMQNFQNRDSPPVNQNFQNPTQQREVPPVPGNNAQNTMPPPLPNSDFNAMPNAGPVGAGYQNQMPNPQNNYAPDARGPPAGPAYQGNSQGYQGNDSAGGAYYQQGGNSGYQRGPRPAYQQGPPPYQQGSGPGYQQGSPAYQQGPPPPHHQQGGGPAYQQGPPLPPHQHGGSPPYPQGPPQPPPQHGPGYQQGVPSYQSGPGYQGRDQ